ncbi:MAG: FeoB-associated Cys-rich membrane protein [Bacteroides sp.]|nr:FeoB-associated Cys-rich membrane protein [Roseburia sp.]MCM1346247.1 FeoB-associated Cys-rich membrane protein [Bacteroides sp.]MCM1420820.1 FeoB-associated Cys-rich membrane protein [Bacteroides sp.]
MQEIIVAIIITLAVAAIIRYICRQIRGKGGCHCGKSGCEGCCGNRPCSEKK